jgi:hypothetical protein
MIIATALDRDATLEKLAAELTNAAYPVVLRYDVGAKWLDLQLDLWEALTDTLKRLGRGDNEYSANSSVHPMTSDFFG